jgi:NAD(P)-dependent dehydrogenase (short-subunit alcohol dehydrogenase family)
MGSEMRGKKVLITGANRGIGFSTTKRLASLGASIVMGCRNIAIASEICDAVRRDTGNPNIEVMELDLASIKAIHVFSEKFSRAHPKLDVLINNAGTFSMKREETIDGFEKTIGTNYLGPFLLTSLLLPCLQRREDAQIINLSSNAHYYGNLDLEDLQRKRRYQGFLAYAASKLAIVFFTQELAERLEGRVRVNAVHPGHVATHMWEIFPRFPLLQSMLNMISNQLMISTDEAADSILYLTTAEEIAGISGKYFDEKVQRAASKKCRNLAFQKDLFKLSEKLTSIQVMN